MPTSPFQSILGSALSEHQIRAMREEVREDEDEGYVLDVLRVHGNAVRGLARHGLVVMSASTYAPLTPLGVRFHAALNDLDPDATLRKHAAHFDSAADLALFSAGV